MGWLDEEWGIKSFKAKRPLWWQLFEGDAILPKRIEEILCLPKEINRMTRIMYKYSMFIK